MLHAPTVVTIEQRLDGTSPVSPLPKRLSWLVKPVRLPIDGGIVPVKSFPPRRRMARSLRLPMEDGIWPVSSLKLIHNPAMPGIDPMHDGILPVI